MQVPQLLYPSANSTGYSLINANKMENTHTHKIMTFNGEEGMFPMYHVKFTAVVYGMGSKYFNALNGIAPYDT